MYGYTNSYINTGYIYSKKCSPLEGIFLWLYENSPQENGFCECYPAGRSGRRVRKQFATKGEALAFERHTMEETEAKPGWVNQWIVEH